MYNEDLKKWFLEDNKITDVSKKTKLQIFKHTEKIETLKDIDCSQWTASEIVDFYKSISTSSVQTLKGYHSILNNYTDFCLSHLLVPDHQNHYKEISSDTINSCVNKIEADAKFISPDEVIKKIEELMNPIDQFIIRALFEGISGDNRYSDIRNAKMSDFNGNEMKLSSGKTIQVSDKLIEYARNALKQTEYIPLNGNERRKIGLVADGDHIYKLKVNSRPAVYKDRNNGFAGRIRNVIRNGMGFQHCVPKSIQKSGMIYYIVNDAKQLGITPEEYISDMNIRGRSEDRFSKIQDVKYFLSEYGEYLK